MTYRACLVFGSEQAAAAEALRHALSQLRTPKSLIGLVGANGKIPADIDLTLLGPLAPLAHGQLPEEVESELITCDGLVVLCSPATATDIAISRAVDRFTALGRGRRVFAVIAPDAPDTDELERDFFPPALLGRAFMAADLRDIRRADGALVGDGREAGLLRLHAALLGVGAHRLAEEQGRAARSRITNLTLLAAALAVIAVAGVGYGAFAAHNASQVERARQDALRHAEEATRHGQEVSAAREAETAARARADAAAAAEHATLLQGVQSLVTQANVGLDAIRASQSASPGNLRQLGAIETAIRQIGDKPSVFGVRPETMTSLWEKLADAYSGIGRAEEARRTQTRFSQYNQRVAQNSTADPAWRAAYATSLAGLYAARLAKQDRDGALNALKDAAQIDVALCDARTAVAASAQQRANACLALAGLELRRARVQGAAHEAVDTAALTRASTLLQAAVSDAPDNRALQSGAPALTDQLARALARQDGAQN